MEKQDKPKPKGKHINNLINLAKADYIKFMKLKKKVDEDMLYMACCLLEEANIYHPKFDTLPILSDIYSFMKETEKIYMKNGKLQNIQCSELICEEVREMLKNYKIQIGEKDQQEYTHFAI